MSSCTTSRVSVPLEDRRRRVREQLEEALQELLELREEAPRERLREARGEHRREQRDCALVQPRVRAGQQLDQQRDELGGLVERGDDGAGALHELRRRALFAEARLGARGGLQVVREDGAAQEARHDGEHGVARGVRVEELEAREQHWHEVLRLEHAEREGVWDGEVEAEVDAQHVVDELQRASGSA